MSYTQEITNPAPVENLDDMVKGYFEKYEDLHAGGCSDEDRIRNLISKEEVPLSKAYCQRTLEDIFILYRKNYTPSEFSKIIRSVESNNMQAYFDFLDYIVATFDETNDSYILFNDISNHIIENRSPKKKLIAKESDYQKALDFLKGYIEIAGEDIDIGLIKGIDSFVDGISYRKEESEFEPIDYSYNMDEDFALDGFIHLVEDLRTKNNSSP